VGVKFLTLRKECKLKMFENEVLKEVFGSKKHKISEQFKMLHNEKLCDLYRYLVLLG
jgi:hypothetical protein